MKILVAVPTFENITAETFKSIYDLDAHGHELSFEYVKGYDCARARNDIGKKTIEGGYDYVLMVDSDIILPKDALKNLLEFPSEITLGCYPHKNTDNGEAELFKANLPNFVNRISYSELNGKIRVEVKGGGFGCALVKASVFQKIAFPWFKYVVYDNGSLLSEDLYFCDQAKKNRIAIWADARVRCGHLRKSFQYK